MLEYLRWCTLVKIDDNFLSGVIIDLLTKETFSNFQDEKIATISETEPVLPTKFVVYEESSQQLIMKPNFIQIK